MRSFPIITSTNTGHPERSDAIAARSRRTPWTVREDFRCRSLVSSTGCSPEGTASTFPQPPSRSFDCAPVPQSRDGRFAQDAPLVVGRNDTVSLPLQSLPRLTLTGPFPTVLDPRAKMSAATSIVTHSVGRTFTVAITILGLFALAQLGAAGWFFFHRFQNLAARASTPAQTATDQSTNLAATPRLPTATGQDDAVPDPFPSALETSVGPIAPPAKPEPVSHAKLNPPPPPPENRFQELMQQGRTMRGRGDTNAALIRFREASTLEPANAETIAEIAMTYERMGLGDKAAEQWKRIFDMGEGAGSFFIAAESRLKMSQVQAVAAAQLAGTAPLDNAPVSSLRADAVLGLGEITREDRPDASALLKFAVRIALKARRDAKVDVKDVDIHVLFYDQVEKKTVVQTGAEVTYRFTSAPVDWANGDAETLEVQYLQPLPLAKGPKTEERSYYGFVVRVYYKDELQDTRAEPETLNAKFPAPQILDRTANPK